MRLLDRYVFARVLGPVLLLVGGFSAVFILFDMTETAAKLFGEGGGIGVALRYYLTQMPYLLMLCLPASILLGTLYGVGRMSRRNETTSILTAGVGFFRMLLPVLVLGLIASLIGMGLSRDWATEFDAQKSKILDQMTGRARPQLAMNAHLFRNRQDLRTWFVEELPLEGNRLRGVEITQFREDGTLERKWYAGAATFVPTTRVWILENAKLLRFRADGVILEQSLHPEIILNDWTETAWRLVSSAYKARYLGSTNLERYLSENADFPAPQLAPFRTYLAYRIAQPWACLVVALIAAPLAVMQNRRGMFANLGLALGLFFAYLFLSTIFLALGEGSRIAPWLAAWGPNLFFGGIGLLLFWMRSGNRLWSGRNKTDTFYASQAGAVS